MHTNLEIENLIQEWMPKLLKMWNSRQTPMHITSPYLLGYQWELWTKAIYSRDIPANFFFVH